MENPRPKDRFETIAEILEYAESPTGLDNVQRKYGMAPAESRRYMRLLIDLGLLERTLFRKYHTTARGKGFLERYGELSKK